MATKKQSSEVFAIFANKSYGLYAGLYTPGTGMEQADGTTKHFVRDCRHVARWYGKTGGITSLAVFGLCGPKAGASLVGPPSPGVSELGGVVNVFPCSREARATIEAATQE